MYMFLSILQTILYILFSFANVERKKQLLVRKKICVIHFFSVIVSLHF